MSVRSLLGACLALTLVACRTDEPTESQAADAIAGVQLVDFDQLLPWGDVIARPPAADFAGDGPSGLAIAPDGSVLVADRLGGRLYRVGPKGGELLFAIPEDVEHIATDTTGAIALFSPLRSRAWVHDASGALIGEVPVPRLFGDVTRVHLGPSRQVILQNAFQERFTAGSPSAPLSPAEAIRSKEEPRLATIRAADGAAYLVELGPSDEGRTVERRRVSIGGGVAAARLLASGDGVAVVAIDHVSQPTETIAVKRAVLAMDVATGAHLREIELPARGLFATRETLAASASPPAVAFMNAEEGGLRVVRVSLASEGGAR